MGGRSCEAGRGGNRHHGRKTSESDVCLIIMKGEGVGRMETDDFQPVAQFQCFNQTNREPLI